MPSLNPTHTSFSSVAETRRVYRPVYTNGGTIGDGLTDTGESIHLIDEHGGEIAFLFQSTWPEDQSLVRTPPDSSALVPHKTVSPTEAPFSPGDAPEPRPVLTYPLFISEVLADPPEGSEGDANRDGQRHRYEDEFIELYKRWLRYHLFSRLAVGGL